MAKKQHNFVTGRRHVVLDQKIQVFHDPRTKRDRDRSTQTRNAVDRSVRGE